MSERPLKTTGSTKIFMNSDSTLYANNNNYQSKIYEHLISIVLPQITTRYESMIINSGIKDQLNHKNESLSNPSNGILDDNKVKRIDDQVIRILDIGSGDGYSTHKLYQTLIGSVGIPENGILLVGLDALPTMVAHANQLYYNEYLTSQSKAAVNGEWEMHGFTGLHFVCGDISDPNIGQKLYQALALASKFGKTDNNRNGEKEFYNGDENIHQPWIQFDHVISSCCFQWIDDQVQALKNVKTLLKPVTSAYSSFVDVIFIDRNVGNLNYAIKCITNDPQWFPYVSRLISQNEDYKLPWHRWYMCQGTNPNLYYRKEIMVQGAGYCDNRINMTRLDEELGAMRFPSQLAIKNFLKGIFPQILPVGMEEELKERFFDEITDYLVEYNGAHDDHDPLDMRTPLLHIHYSQ